MSDKKNTHGGARKGAGAPTKAEQVKANNIFLSMAKSFYEVETDDEAKQKMAKELWSFERGKMFIAEHIFGKAPQEVKQTNFNIDANALTDEEIKRIDKALNNAY